MVELSYAALSRILGTVLQIIAILGNYFNAIFQLLWFGVPGSRNAEQLTNTSHHINRMIINKMAAVQMFV
jgi:hypothetical protein